MRMLTEEDREALLRLQRREWVECREPLPASVNLINAGRAAVVDGPEDSQFAWVVQSTYFGELALRIDALIRQWGYQP